MKGRLVLLGLAVGGLIGLMSGHALAQDEAVWLITEGEAMLAPPPTARAAPELPRGGPIIKVLSPSLNGEIVPPFPIEIVFEPRPGGAPVQIESLKVTYLRLFEIDITERFRPHIRENRIVVQNAKIPSGRHRLKILIADRDGNLTAEIMEVRVR